MEIFIDTILLLYGNFLLYIRNKVATNIIELEWQSKRRNNDLFIENSSSNNLNCDHDNECLRMWTDIV